MSLLLAAGSWLLAPGSWQEGRASSGTDQNRSSWAVTLPERLRLNLKSIYKLLNESDTSVTTGCICIRGGVCLTGNPGLFVGRRRAAPWKEGGEDRKPEVWKEHTAWGKQNPGRGEEVLPQGRRLTAVFTKSDAEH